MHRAIYIVRKEQDEYRLTDPPDRICGDCVGCVYQSKWFILN